jgi:phospholipid-translocating ATPase
VSLEVRLSSSKHLKKRTIALSGATTPRRFPSNKINNTKYNILTFIPVVLYHQFKFFFNLFFLLICLSQMIPALKVGKPWS